MSQPQPSVPEAAANNAESAEFVVMFDGRVQIEYGQFYLQSADNQGEPEFEEAFIGQRNGLCGAATVGQLLLITGPNVGEPHVRAELHAREPAIADQWEDIVEATLTVPQPSPHSLVEWAGDAVGDPTHLDAGSYRVRYSASGMDGDSLGSSADSDADEYLLQLWPASTAPDRVVKQTSRSAAYWHANFSAS